MKNRLESEVTVEPQRSFQPFSLSRSLFFIILIIIIDIISIIVIICIILTEFVSAEIQRIKTAFSQI